MANFSNLITTLKGHELIVKILAGEIATNAQSPFTRLVTSSAVYQMSDLEALTNLTDIKQESLVSGVTKQNQTTVRIEGRMDNSRLTVGYRLNTVGIFFADPGDMQEHLFGVAIHIPTQEEPSSDFVFPFNGLTTTGLLFDLIASVGNADNISLDVSPAATVTIKQLQGHDVSETAHENRFAEMQKQIDFIMEFIRNERTGILVGADGKEREAVIQLPDGEVHPMLLQLENGHIKQLVVKN